MNEKENYRPVLSYYHPNAKGTGCAASFELHPAHDGTSGSIFMCLAAQSSAGDRSRGVFPSFDWKNKICVKLDLADLSQMLFVFRGMSENIADGKGLFHRSATANTIIRLEHRIEPIPGYLLDLSRKSGEGGEGQRAAIFLSTVEALGLSLAIEQSLSVIAFGIPQVRIRELPVPVPAAEPEPMPQAASF